MVKKKIFEYYQQQVTEKELFHWNKNIAQIGKNGFTITFQKPIFMCPSPE